MNYNWIYLSALAAITFALGDFVVVLSKEKGMDIYNLYMTYSVIVGLLSLIAIIYSKSSVKHIKNFSLIEWIIVLVFSTLYFTAYMSHFIALQNAPNPGYSNALIMFHVVILTVLSTIFLKKPLNKMTVLGIAIVMVGSHLITTYA